MDYQVSYLKRLIQVKFINTNSFSELILYVVVGLNLTSLPEIDIWTVNKNSMVGDGVLLNMGSHKNLLL